MKKPIASGPIIAQAVVVTHVMHVDQRILDKGPTQTATPVNLSQPHANELVLSETDGNPTGQATIFGFAKQHQPTTLMSVVVNVGFPPVGGAAKLVSATLSKDAAGNSKLTINP